MLKHASRFAPHQEQLRLQVSRGHWWSSNRHLSLFLSPGGWQLTGHTKQALFDKNQAQPTLLQAGDTVKFVVEGIEL